MKNWKIKRMIRIKEIQLSTVQFFLDNSPKKKERADLYKNEIELRSQLQILRYIFKH